MFHWESFSIRSLNLLLCVFGQIPDTICFLFSKGALPGMY